MSKNTNTTVPAASKSFSLWTRIPAIIGLLWFVIIVFEYLFFHPYYTQSISTFSYSGLLGTLSILFGAAYFFFFKTKSKFSTINGWKLYTLFLLVTNSVLAWYGISNDIFQTNPLKHLGYFTGFTILLHLAILYITALGYALGERLLSPFSQQLPSGSFSIIAIALGWSVISFLMLLLGLFKILNPVVLWTIASVITILCYRSMLRFLKRLLLQPISVKSINTIGILSVVFLFIFLGVNALGATKAFPSGFDGAGLYINISKLIGEYHALPQGGQAFNWSIFMSIGNLLFGSITVTILLSNLLGIFCVVAIYRIARLFVSVSNALLAAAIFYTAPALTFHNYFDEKVDLGFLFISLCTLLFLFEYFAGKKFKEHKTFSFRIGKFNVSHSILVSIYLGWLTGFAFGIKYVALFNILALAGLLFYKKGGHLAFWGSLCTSLSVLFLLGIHQFADLELDGISPVLIGALLLVPGITFLAWAFHSSYPQLLKTGILIGVFLLSLGINYTPWLVKHAFENKSIRVASLVTGKTPEPKIRIKPRFRSAKQKKNKELSRKKREATTRAAQQTRREELKRYQGFESGLPLFLSIPYDSTMNTNLPNRSYLDIGFLWLLLLPLLLLPIRPRSAWKNLLWLFLMLFFLLVSILSVFVKKSSIISPEAYIDRHAEGFQSIFGGLWQSGMNSLISLSKTITPVYDWIAGFNILASLIALLLLFFFVSWLASERLKGMSKLLKKLFAFTTIYLFVWLLMGSAVPWYAFMTLAILAIILVYYFEHPQLLFGIENTGLTNGLLTVSLSLYFIFNLSLHFYDANRPSNQHLIYQTPLVEYASKDLQYNDVLTLFNPSYVEALNHLNQNPSKKIYRVGTFLNYHILQNDQRVVEDNQLGKFSEITAKLSDPNYFLPVLRDQGFRYILYDLNTVTLDRTPEKSLTKKNEDFINQILDPNAVRLLVTDRIIEDPNNIIELPDGKINGRYGLNGKVVYSGSFVLFEIL